MSASAHGQVADRFGLDEMLQQGLALFEKALSTQSAIPLLVWAHSEGPAEALRICCDYVTHNLQRIHRDAPDTLELLHKPCAAGLAVDVLKALASI
jgi:hypothetical protein